MALAVTTLTLLVGALLYFTGWMYLYYFLEEFGFSIFETSIPFHYVMVYSFAVVSDLLLAWQSRILVTLILLSTFLFIVQMLQKTEDKTDRVQKKGLLMLGISPAPALVAVVVAVFAGAHSEARHSAYKEANSIRAFPEPAILSLKPEAATNVTEYAGLLSGRSLSSYLMQDSSARDWQDFAVEIVFADSKYVFLVLRNNDARVETTLRMEKSHFTFIGSHYGL